MFFLLFLFHFWSGYFYLNPLYIIMYSMISKNLSILSTQVYYVESKRHSEEPTDLIYKFDEIEITRRR